jgi:hypothetical protein
MAAVRRNKSGLGATNMGSFANQSSVVPAAAGHHSKKHVHGGHNHHAKLKRGSHPGQIR